MNKIMQEIENLRSDMSYTYFKERLSDDDYKFIDEIKQKISELEKLLPSEGIALRLTHKKAGYSFWLTADISLCCGDEPVWFDNESEAIEYLHKAELHTDDFNVEVIHHD